MERRHGIMKKKNLALLAAVVLTAGVLAGCGQLGEGEPANDLGESGSGLSSEPVSDGTPVNENPGNENTGNENTGDEAASQADIKGFGFEVNGVVLVPDMDFDAVLSQIGGSEIKEPFAAPSCAGQGTSYTYDFGSFQVETYPSEEVEKAIAYIILKDDTVATMEGIDLSMTREDIIEAYGDSYTETEKGLIYEKDGVKLKFIFEGDNIVSIEYASAVVG